jgi:hypothetical protein
MLRKNIALMAAVLVAILGLSACDSAAPEPTTPTTPTTQMPDETPTTVPDDRPEHDLADGETFAWLRGLTGDGLIVDPAEMLTGEEARQAAVDAGVIEEGEDLPNDFFILDESDETSVVGLAEGAEFALLLFEDGSPVETAVGYDEFASALEGANPDVYGVMDGVIPATVTIEDGVIVSIVQTYLP